MNYIEGTSSAHQVDDYGTPLIAQLVGCFIGKCSQIVRRLHHAWGGSNAS